MRRARLAVALGALVIFTVFLSHFPTEAKSFVLETSNVLVAENVIVDKTSVQPNKCFSFRNRIALLFIYLKFSARIGIPSFPRLNDGVVHVGHVGIMHNGIWRGAADYEPCRKALDDCWCFPVVDELKIRNCLSVICLACKRAWYSTPFHTDRMNEEMSAFQFGNRLGCGNSRFCSFSGFPERLPDQIHAEGGKHYAYYSDYNGPVSPFGHIPLSLKIYLFTPLIPIGIWIALWGAYRFRDSQTPIPGAGFLLFGSTIVGLSVSVILFA